MNHRLGVLYQRQGRFQKALHFHSNYLNYSKEQKNTTAEGLAYCGMAECYEALHEPDKAVEALEMYLDVSRNQACPAVYSFWHLLLSGMINVSLVCRLK